MAEYVVGMAAEIPPGERKILEVRGRSIAVFNMGGEFFALRNSCPHLGGPVCQGDIVGTLRSDGPRHYEYDAGARYVQCPWHNWEYDIRTGQSWFDPEENATRAYEVKIMNGAAIIEAEEPDADHPGRRKGPYVAETYRVSVEDDYLIVSI